MPTQTGTLGLDAGATDYFQVTCSDDGAGAPAALVAQIRDEPPVAAPLLSVQVQRGAVATNSTDSEDGDALLSPLVFVNIVGGATAPFDVFVDKTAAGAESYTLTVTCMTGAGGTGVPTGTSITGTEPTLVSALSASGALVLGVALFAAAALVLRRRAALVVLLLALGHAPSAGADTQTGTLGSTASATDFYQVTCTDDGGGPPGQMVMQVRDEAPASAAIVSVQVHKAGLLVNSTDPAEGDTAFSPLVMVNGGAGVYEVLVDKSGAGAEGYTLNFHCLVGTNGAGMHTGTTITAVQNQ